MDRNPVKIFTAIVILLISTLACSSIYVFGTSEDNCLALGGRWVSRIDPSASDGLSWDCVAPLPGNSAPENAGSQPADPTGGEPAREISLKTCLADPENYSWEFSILENGARNDTKNVCRGDFIIRNLGSRVLYLKWFEYWDNGAMQDIGWMDLYQRLEPGDEFSEIFETQTWTTGEETVNTYQKLLVLYDIPGCQELLGNQDYQSLWDEYSLPLSDPCR